MTNLSPHNTNPIILTVLSQFCSIAPFVFFVCQHYLGKILNGVLKNECIIFINDRQGGKGSALIAIINTTALTRLQ